MGNPTTRAASADEKAFLDAYDPRSYEPVGAAVDVVAFTIRDDELHVLLVQRAAHPFRGAWALPGGFVTGRAPGASQETLEQAAARQLVEKTGLNATATDTTSEIQDALDRIHLEQLGTYGAPDRDPRMRVLSVAYLAFAPDLPEPAAGADAPVASWVPVASLGLPDAATAGRPVKQRSGTTRKLAFDHAQIIFDGLERARAKLEYSPLATAFVGEEFTISELRAVYETVWGEKLHAGNFHRKVLSVPGLVDSIGETTARGGARGGPRAKLYRRGDAQLLHPALLRPAREDEIR